MGKVYGYKEVSERKAVGMKDRKVVIEKGREVPPKEDIGARKRGESIYDWLKKMEVGDSVGFEMKFGDKPRNVAAALSSAAAKFKKQGSRMDWTVRVLDGGKEVRIWRVE